MYVEELAHNGAFQFFYAFRHNDLEYDKFYQLIDEKKASDLLKANVVLPHETFLNPNELFDVTRQVSVKEPERHLNVMLITVESLSGDYLTAFGSKDNITPKLDKLAKESLFFTNIMQRVIVQCAV
jgi:phosphoglycerol transferase MdoB-like AlkP superfamily enzyme